MSDLVTKFGRVDEQNNVFVIISGNERKVGQYPNVTAEAALAFFEKKFSDLDAQVRILEQRFAKKVDSHLLKKAQENLAKELVEPNAVGDIENLQKRVAALASQLEVISKAQKEENQAANDASLANRERIAARAEAIMNKDLAKIQWKTTSIEMTKLFEEWQAEQKAHPKVPKSISEPICKRFSAARNKFETEKRAYFAKLTAATKSAKNLRLELIKRAEKLAAKSDATTAEYRALLEEWKSTGKSNGKADEELWNQFKTFGDSIFAARKEQIETENAEFAKNLDAKLALLVDANKIDASKDLAVAKTQLLAIQQKWEKIGKVPRDKVREIEDKLRNVESKVKAAEQELWRKTDPATKARTNSVLEQLEQTISKLENELAEAVKAKNAKAIKSAEEALAARKAWLEVVVASAN